ncbi:MAG: hypothetical protein K9J51_10890 [Desulfotignum sp.]|nr:hypothetical protein [Desulfotignum sp.]
MSSSAASPCISNREDDPRTGGISGLDEKKGKQHPTRGGLRIGKPLNERRSDEPFDQNLEWDRDGQYYHYLINLFPLSFC